MSGRLAGKTALVTGGASGIGAACANRLAAEGAAVMITDVDDRAGAERAAAIKAAGQQASYLHQDVSDESQWRAVVDQLSNGDGELHVLVNNAGIAVGGSLFEMSLEDWHRQQGINLDGVFLGLKHAIPLIRDSGGGSVINMSSVAGLKGSPNLAAYCATKGGVRLLTKGAALECAQLGWPVRVNSVHPGIINTPIWRTVDPAMIQEGANEVDVDALAAGGAPMGVAGRPEDIANGVLFLASEESSYMTGAELVIDGGISA